MADITRRTELGPTMKFNSTEDRMARIASENTFVTDNDGIRRFVAAGSPIPGYLGMEVEGAAEVPTRDLARVVVDEEASKSHAERTGTEQAVRTTTLGVTEAIEKDQKQRATGVSAKAKVSAEK